MKTTDAPLSSRRSLSALLRIALAVALAAVASTADAAALLINSGLAPPTPANVIDHFVSVGAIGDLLDVHDAGCSPRSRRTCSNPNAPTTVAITAGGVVSNTLVYGSSHIDMQGGDVYGLYLAASDSASILMSGGRVHGILEAIFDARVSFTGGHVEQQVRAFDRAQITITGGTIGTGGAPFAQIRTFQQSLIQIVGHDFKIDGASVSFGDISALTGRLTGTLASGEALDYRFERLGGGGTIRLIANPEPGTAVLLGFGLLGLARYARARAPR